MSGEQAFWNSRNKASAQYMFGNLVDPTTQGQFQNQIPPTPVVIDEVEIIHPITGVITKAPLTKVPKQ